jgi:SAM-dependent methyltransferase
MSRRVVLRGEIKTGLSHQPLGDFAPTYKRSERFFTDRLALLRDVARDSGSRNVLDIGCAEGYFFRGLAQDPGILGLGVDSDWNALRKGAALQTLREEEGYSFFPMRLDSGSIRALPNFDLVICFWVLHHIVKKEGRHAAVEFLEACSAITGRKFIFGMGGPLDEGSPGGAAKLEFLGTDAESIADGIVDLLQVAGFRNCRVLGWTTSQSGTDLDRGAGRHPVFVCDPPV